MSKPDIPQSRPVRLDTSLESLLARPELLERPGVLATVVATAGSTYRKSGARMLIAPDGRHVGLLSGGCLEGDLAAHAASVLAEGNARCIAYDLRGPDDLLFGIGAGCEGAMRILLEPVGPDYPAGPALRAAHHAVSEGRTTALICVHESPDIALGTYGDGAKLPEQVLLAGREVQETECSCDLDVDSGNGMTRAFVQYLAPAPNLLVCGAGPDAVPVVAAARALAWRVTVIDHRPAYAEPGRFPGATVIFASAAEMAAMLDLSAFHAAIVMSHHFESDAAYLATLARAGIPEYVGLLGPPARRQRLAAELGGAGADLLDRLHAPVGLPIGAVTPEGIAVSIVAQVHAWLARQAHAKAHQRTAGA